VSLYVDRSLPLKQLNCDLGPTDGTSPCETAPLLKVEWKVWDGSNLVKSWSANPIRASSWSADEAGCVLGGFEGKRNGMFSLEWNVKKDAGRLAGLHPHVQIVKNIGFWCWL
jgi:hypothetical protein